MELDGHTQKGEWALVDIDINIRIFVKKFIFSKFINRGRTTITRVPDNMQFI